MLEEKTDRKFALQLIQYDEFKVMISWHGEGLNWAADQMTLNVILAFRQSLIDLPNPNLYKG